MLLVGNTRTGKALVGSRTRPHCSFHDNGVSLARSNSDTVSGRVSSRIAARMSGAPEFDTKSDFRPIFTIVSQ
jgi:hypothetical protein